ncbi:MAG: hypothetical protein D0530_12775 [Methylococcales bacterium]|nr:MAG: hypothetical protein D0530_12775 [Methylococcales bacterium]
MVIFSSCFTLLHIDTIWEFAEMARFRDNLVANLGLDLKVHSNWSVLAANLQSHSSRVVD